MARPVDQKKLLSWQQAAGARGKSREPQARAWDPSPDQSALGRKKRKHSVRASSPFGLYTDANQEWALDFVHDVLAAGRSIRVLNRE